MPSGLCGAFSSTRGRRCAGAFRNRGRRDERTADGGVDRRAGVAQQLRAHSRRVRTGRGDPRRGQGRRVRARRVAGGAGARGGGRRSASASRRSARESSCARRASRSRSWSSAGAARDEAAEAAARGLRVAVFDAATGARSRGGALGERALAVHVKIDTGMTRLGALPEDLPAADRGAARVSAPARRGRLLALRRRRLGEHAVRGPPGPSLPRRRSTRCARRASRRAGSISPTASPR